jgi:hypothetical protein
VSEFERELENEDPDTLEEDPDTREDALLIDDEAEDLLVEDADDGRNEEAGEADKRLLELLEDELPEDELLEDELPAILASPRPEALLDADFEDEEAGGIEDGSDEDTGLIDDDPTPRKAAEGLDAIAELGTAAGIEEAAWLEATAELGARAELGTMAGLEEAAIGALELGLLAEE